MNDTHHEVVIGDEQTPEIPSGTDERADDEADYDSDNECKEFFFESDHLALRGNPDYTSVLRTIAILQTQRIQISKDFDRLAQAERDALDDPEVFIQKLARGELQMPTDVTAIEVSLFRVLYFTNLLTIIRSFQRSISPSMALTFPIS